MSKNLAPKLKTGVRTSKSLSSGDSASTRVSSGSKKSVSSTLSKSSSTSRQSTTVGGEYRVRGSNESTEMQQEVLFESGRSPLSGVGRSAVEKEKGAIETRLKLTARSIIDSYNKKKKENNLGPYGDVTVNLVNPDHGASASASTYESMVNKYTNPRSNGGGRGR